MMETVNNYSSCVLITQRLYYCSFMEKVVSVSCERRKAPVNSTGLLCFLVKREGVGMNQQQILIVMNIYI